ncbi:hypothetical protein BsWGS_17124 [Bradybaena similaris]
MARHTLNDIRILLALLATWIARVYTANIQINPSGPNLLVGLGNKQILDCFVSSDQTTGALVYKWNVPPGANVEINGTVDGTNTSHSILTIESFNSTDVGNYICTYTATGDKTDITLVSVTENKTEGVYSFGNVSATLMCSLELPPGIQATFQEWLRDNISLSKLADHGRFIEYDNSTLFIKHPTRRDGGLYIARYNVSMEYGSYYDCEVVYKAAPLVLDMEKSKNLVEGEQLEMNCLVKGYPTPTVRWFQNGYEIKDGGRVHLADHNGVKNAVISIESVQDSDGGKYICNATDDDGQYSYKSITVRIKDHLDWLWPIIGIICEAIVLTIVVIMCTKFNKHHDD